MIVYKDAADAGEFFFGSDRLHHVATYLGVRPLTAHL